MPIHFPPAWASAVPHLDAIGGVDLCLDLCIILPGKRRGGSGVSVKLILKRGKLAYFNTLWGFRYKRPSALLTIRFLQRSRKWHIYSDVCSGLRLLRPAVPRFIFKPHRIASHISLSLGQLSECAPAVNKSSEASQSDWNGEVRRIGLNVWRRMRGRWEAWHVANWVSLGGGALGIINEWKKWAWNHWTVTLHRHNQLLEMKLV